MWHKVEKLDSLVEHCIETVKANGYMDEFLQFSNMKEDISTEFALKIGAIGESGVGASTFLEKLNVCIQFFLTLYHFVLIDYYFSNNFLIKLQIPKPKW